MRLWVLFQGNIAISKHLGLKISYTNRKPHKKLKTDTNTIVHVPIKGPFNQGLYSNHIRDVHYQLYFSKVEMLCKPKFCSFKKSPKHANFHDLQNFFTFRSHSSPVFGCLTAPEAAALNPSVSPSFPSNYPRKKPNLKWVHLGYFSVYLLRNVSMMLRGHDLLAFASSYSGVRRFFVVRFSQWIRQVNRLCFTTAIFSTLPSANTGEHKMAGRISS